MLFYVLAQAIVHATRKCSYTLPQNNKMIINSLSATSAVRTTTIIGRGDICELELKGKIIFNSSSLVLDQDPDR